MACMEALRCQYFTLMALSFCLLRASSMETEWIRPPSNTFAWTVCKGEREICDRYLGWEPGLPIGDNTTLLSFVPHVPGHPSSPAYFELDDQATSFFHTFNISNWIPPTPNKLYASVHAQSSVDDPAPLRLCVVVQLNNGAMPVQQCATQVRTSLPTVYVPSLELEVDTTSIPSGQPVAFSVYLERDITGQQGSTAAFASRWYNLSITSGATRVFSNKSTSVLTVGTVTPSRVCGTDIRMDAAIPVTIATNARQHLFVDQTFLQATTTATAPQWPSSLPSSATLSQATPYDWVPVVTIGGYPCRVTRFTMTELSCDLQRPLVALLSDVTIAAGGAVVTSQPAVFRFDGCLVDEEDYALRAADLAASSTGAALGVAVITSVLAVFAGASDSAGSTGVNEDVVVAGTLGVGSVFRMVYYIQFISMVGQTAGEIPESNRHYAQEYAWTNGQIFPPWLDCVAPNKTLVEVAYEPEPIIRGGSVCPIPADTLFAATAFWNLLFLGVCLICAKVLTTIVIFLWYRWDWIRSRVDVSHASNFNLVMLMVVTRLMLLGVNGIMVGAFNQIFFQFSSDLLLTLLAFCCLGIWGVGLPYVNIIVLHRIFTGNQFLEKDVKERAQFAFGSLFEGFHENRRYTAVLYLVKRLCIAAMVGGLQNFPRFQMGVILCSNFLFAAWIAIMRPYILPVENRFHTWMECTEVVQSLFFFLLLYSPDTVELTATNMILATFTSITFIVVCIWSVRGVRSACEKLKTATDSEPEKMNEDAFAIDEAHLQHMVDTSTRPDFGARSEVNVQDMNERRASRQGTLSNIPMPRIVMDSDSSDDGEFPTETE